MSLNPAPVGPNIADYFVNNAPTPGTKVTKERLEEIWQGAIALLYGDVQSTADVDPTAHSGEDLSSATGQTVVIPVTSTPGSESTGTVTADKKLVGKGRIL